MSGSKDLASVLLQHCQRYPRMTIQDLVKLVFQNEFAGGHMIADEQTSLQRLHEELQLLDQASADRMPAFEAIGDGLCRLNLKAIRDTGIEPATVNRFFVNTAKSWNGEIDSFEQKLGLLKDLCRDGAIPYTSADLDAYVSVYRQQGYPPVSHSTGYRDCYRPAYRVVRSQYGDFFPLFCRIDSLLRTDDRILVAIDGNSGAGKSSLAALINDVYDCNVFHMDDFFLPSELKTKERLAETGGNVDYGRLRHEIIMGLQSGQAFQYQPYDCKKQALGQPVSVVPKRLNVIEGVYSLHPTLINNYQLKVFLSVDPVQQRRRIERRNGALMLNRFLQEWIPLEDKYFGEMGVREQSDLVFQS